MFLGIVSDIMDAIGNFFGEMINKFIIGVASCVYRIVYYVYQIFIALANVNIFDGDIFETITSKIYLVLGVITLFALAYNLLNLVIDPSKDKGSKQVLDLLKKIITSFILIVLVPVIFKYAILVQNAILTQNFIGELFKTSETSNAKLKYQVATLSRDYFRTFFVPETGSASNIKNESTYGKRTVENFDKEEVTYDCSTKNSSSCTLEKVDEYVEATGDFFMYKSFALNVHHGNVSFDWFISLIVGGYICYVLISFCFDMATRQIKLIFYQILAPICIACRVIPNQEKVFKNWLSAVFKTYMSVFIRLLLLTLSVLLINMIIKNWDLSLSGDICDEIVCSTGVRTFAKIFLILACITFLKQGSKMICELFGFDDVKIKMNGKLKDGGAFMAGSALSSAVTNASRSGSEEFKKMSNAKGWQKLGHFAKGVAGVGTGFASGAVAGAKNGANADSFKGMNDATVKTMNEIENKKKQKAFDKANGNTTLKKTQRWFTGGTDNTSANNQIYSTAKGIVDSAEKAVTGDASKNKELNYGIDRGFGTYTYNGFVDDKGNKREIGYSVANNKRMVEAIKNAEANGSNTVSYIIDPKKKGADGKFTAEGNTVTMDINAFKAMQSEYAEKVEKSESIFKNEMLGDNIIDYNTKMLHIMDQMLEEARTHGDRIINLQKITGEDRNITTGEFSDLRNAYVKSFSETLASVAAQTPELMKAFLAGRMTDDGSDTIGEIYRENLELRKMLQNNQNADIVKELRGLHKKFESTEDFISAINDKQLKFFKNELLGDIKKANQNVNDKYAEKMYRANVMNEKKDK